MQINFVFKANRTKATRDKIIKLQANQNLKPLNTVLTYHTYYQHACKSKNTYKCTTFFTESLNKAKHTNNPELTVNCDKIKASIQPIKYKPYYSFLATTFVPLAVKVHLTLLHKEIDEKYQDPQKTLVSKLMQYETSTVVFETSASPPPLVHI